LPGPPTNDTLNGSLAGNSVAVAAWTSVSRISGFTRVVTTAAVLGPTYLGNTYQTLNLLPTYLFSAFTGSLFTALLVPALMRHIDARDRRTQEEVAGAFLGVAVVSFGVVTVLMLAAGPLLLRLLSLGLDDQVAAAQRRVGWLLMLMLLPQLVLYVVAFTGEAVMNAHGRFALAAAAPALENLGTMVTLVAFAVVFGTGTALEDATTGQLVLLGLGTTAGVALHAAVQWWGAWRAGVLLIPRMGWRHPEVRAIIRRAVPSLGYSLLHNVRGFAPFLAASTVPGGAVAFETARTFALLPVGLGARPVAVALLPRLSRLFERGRLEAFREELVRGVALASLVVVPAAVAYATLAAPLAEAISLGAMANTDGTTLIAVSIAALAPGVLGASGFYLATNCSYARHDAASPFRSMILRTGIVLAALPVAFLVTPGPAVLLVLCLATSAADLIATAHLTRRVRAGLPRTGTRLAPALARSAVGSIVMAGPAYLVATRLPGHLHAVWARPVGIAAAVVLGLVLFACLQWLWRSPELGALIGGLRRSTLPGAEP
jgi:putative peptidoglycan lipid II flippase